MRGGDPTLTADNTDNADLHGSKKFKKGHFEFVIRVIPVHPW
jgi:hypothetical protein